MMSMSQNKEVHEDHCCPICLTAFYLPIQISHCKHIFCQPCLQDSAILSGKRKCPLCRESYSPLHILMQDKLRQEVQKTYPHIIEEKKKHIKAKKLFHLRIGNKTRLIQTKEDNRYEWTMFVKSSPEEKPLNQYAQKVEIKLHQTFRPNKIVYDMKNLQGVELKRIGWGTFRIYVKIIWKDIFEQKQTQLYHDLQFEPMVERQVGCYLHQKKPINA